MCIIYYATFATCTHRDFLGSYHCGYPGCSISAQHIFDVEDAGFPCETCDLLDKKNNEELPPVEWYPPVPDIQLALAARPGWANPKIVIVGGQSDDSDARTHATSYPDSLSDAESVTSFWRLDANGKAQYMRAKTGTEDDKFEFDGSGNGSDGTLPAGFVRSPAHHANSPASTAFGISPNTAKHRNLVQDQLAALLEPFPTRPFAESPERMSTPALRTMFQPNFAPMLPAGLPSYPVLPAGLINYPVSAYPPGMTDEHFPPLQRQSPVRGGPAMTSQGLHGPPAMNGEHFPALQAGREASAQATPLEQPQYKYRNAGYNLNAPAPGNTPFNMSAIFNSPSRYNNSGAFGGAGGTMGMSRFTLNPLAPQFRGTPKGKGKARARDD